MVDEEVEVEVEVEVGFGSGYKIIRDDCPCDGGPGLGLSLSSGLIFVVGFTFFRFGTGVEFEPELEVSSFSADELVGLGPFEYVFTGGLCQVREGDVGRRFIFSLCGEGGGGFVGSDGRISNSSSEESIRIISGEEFADGPASPGGDWFMLIR